MIATGFAGDGSGLTGVPGDDLGDHTVTQNIELDINWLSNDGADKGIYVDAAGNVGINTNIADQELTVEGNIRTIGQVMAGFGTTDNPLISLWFRNRKFRLCQPLCQLCFFDNKRDPKADGQVERECRHR